MSIDRAPKGTHAGGQFVSSPRSEPTISLNHDHSSPSIDSRAEAPDPTEERQLGFWYEHIFDHTNNSLVDYDSLTSAERARMRKMAKEEGRPDPRPRRGLWSRAEKLGDDISETVDAISETASHMVDVHRGDAPAPETEGTYVSWDQMIPKFLRRNRR
ncbi:hypothetical protein GCM10023063_15120 [Arthrobacter methylotrophus]|uniref:Uncharacterized protein n=1 Tax=Arthrobacter methylotrophus TaxID=121291 RepID=A0ABV5UN31_9MICC